MTNHLAADCRASQFKQDAYKQSGLGSEGALEGLLEYTNAQTTFVRRG